MARNTQLIQAVEMLRSEIGHALNPAHGADFVDHLKHAIRRTQATLYSEYDWPFLTVWKYITINAGQVNYDIPADIDIEHTRRASVFYNSQPWPVERGIELEDFAIFDSNDNERNDPVQRWDLRWTGTETQIEVWPKPASSGWKLYFVGQRPLRQLISNSDRLDLDDHLVTLFAAAEMLARQEDADASAKLQIAQQHLKNLKAGSKSGSPTIKIGGGPSRQPRRGANIVITPNQG